MSAHLQAQLSAAAEEAGRIVASIGAGQWDLPTPCPPWTVRQLVEHVREGNERFADALAAGSVAAGAAVSAEDGTGDFGRSLDRLLEAFAQPGALERMADVPFGTVPGTVALQLRVTELLVHG